MLDEQGCRLEEAHGDPDALISATDEAWRRLALDVHGGMDAFRARELEVRKNLHLGIGFLAATGATMVARGCARVVRARPPRD